MGERARQRSRGSDPRVASYRVGNHGYQGRDAGAAQWLPAAEETESLSDGTLQRSTSSHQPQIRRADFRPVEISGAPRVSARRAWPEEVAPQAERLRHRPGREAKAPVSVPPARASVPPDVRDRAQEARRD